MSSPNLLKIITVALAISLASLLGTSKAVATENNPSFVTKTISNSKIRAGIAAFEKGSFKKAAFFQNAALAAGLSKSRKLAAYINLCAAEGSLGDLAAAATACDAALSLSADNWQALNNRGVVSWLAGEKAEASAKFIAALNAAEADNDLVIRNAQIAGSDQLALAD